MPAWSGKWEGGRFYLDEGRPVFFIEQKRKGLPRAVKLKVHDRESAVAELALFRRDPAAYCRPAVPAEPVEVGPVHITMDRMRLYLESISHTVVDHRRARAGYLEAWSKLGLDLRTVDRKTLRAALATFSGGHDGRTEALNAFARFLVKEGELPSWNPLVCTIETHPENARAPRVAYSLETVMAVWQRLDEGPVRDVFRLRVVTGMHMTELAQLQGAAILDGPLPEVGAAVRILPKGQGPIAGVLQVSHKNGQWHRVSVDRGTLAAALRMVEHVPDRVTVWEKLGAVDIVPSNLRHTFTTLASEVGKLEHYKSGGVGRAMVAQLLGHRAGSTMTADRYEKVQVPAMLHLPLEFDGQPKRSARSARVQTGG